MSKILCLPVVPKDEPWLLLSGKSGLKYRKEAIYLGDWGKLNSQGEGIEFGVAVDTVRHWQRMTQRFKDLGIAIPLSTSHVGWDRSENKLGNIVDAHVAKNAKGLDALYLDIEFENEASRDIGLKGDVSIGSPPVWYDGAKNKHVYPLQHVASTTAPVIPGLEKWQAIAAAFAIEAAKGTAMEVDEILKKLGIKAPDGASDDVKWALISAKLDEIGGGAAAEPAAADAEPVAASAPAPAAPVTASAPSAPVAGGAQKVTATVAFSHASPPPVLVVSTVRKARQATIDANVSQNKFAPAIGVMLSKQFCDDKAITLSLINNETDEAFDGAIALASAAAGNPPLANRGRTTTPGQDGIELGQDDANSFIALCEETAKAGA